MTCFGDIRGPIKGEREQNLNPLGLLMGIDSSYIPNAENIDVELLKEQSEFLPQISVTVNKTYESNKILAKYCYCGGCNRQGIPLANFVIRIINSFKKTNKQSGYNLCERLHATILDIINKREKENFLKKNGSKSATKRQMWGFIQEPIQIQPLSITIFNEVAIVYYHYHVHKNPGIFLDYMGQLVKSVLHYFTKVNNSATDKRILNAFFTMPSLGEECTSSRLAVLGEYNNETAEQYFSRIINNLINNKEFDNSKVLVGWYFGHAIRAIRNYVRSKKFIIEWLMLQESLELNNKKIILTRKNRFNTNFNNSDLYNLPDLNFNSNQNFEENMDLFNDYTLLIPEFNIKINVQLAIEKKSIKNPFYSINLKSYLEKVWWKTIILWSNIVPAIRNRTRRTTATVEVENNIVKNLDIRKKNLLIDEYLCSNKNFGINTKPNR
ncbi:hypothetical protein C1646_749913 [Rhizophagus diaphanus]|nr:hypothetical protein C1646_749913 [Rhizophagus diaphanus] [Rhizophagus sp. MUCL 43196]